MLSVLTVTANPLADTGLLCTGPSFRCRCYRRGFSEVQIPQSLLFFQKDFEGIPPSTKKGFLYKSHWIIINGYKKCIISYTLDTPNHFCCATLHLTTTNKANSEQKYRNRSSKAPIKTKLMLP